MTLERFRILVYALVYAAMHFDYW